MPPRTINPDQHGNYYTATGSRCEPPDVEPDEESEEEENDYDPKEFGDDERGEF